MTLVFIVTYAAWMILQEAPVSTSLDLATSAHNVVAAELPLILV